jgi:hypothetical protein
MIIGEHPVAIDAAGPAGSRRAGDEHSAQSSPLAAPASRALSPGTRGGDLARQDVGAGGTRRLVRRDTELLQRDARALFHRRVAALVGATERGYRPAHIAAPSEQHGMNESAPGIATAIGTF